MVCMYSLYLVSKLISVYIVDYMHYFVFHTMIIGIFWI